MLRILEENIMYQSFKGGLGGIALAKHGRSRAINAENPHGEKGKGGMAASHGRSHSQVLVYQAPT